MNQTQKPSPTRLPSFKPALLVALSLALFMATVACGQGPMKVALDWYPNSDHAGLYVALEKGYFKEENLDIELYTPANPADVLKTVGAGKDKFGISYQPEVLLARAQGIPVKSIAVIVQHPLNSILTLKDSGITGPEQLKGKTIGYPGIPLNEALLEAVLQNEGLSLKDIELVNVSFNLLPALIGKEVDAVIGAYWTHESILAELEGHPVNIMRLEQWGVPDFYELVLVTSDSMLSKHPDTVERFLRAVSRGYMDAARDPDQAFQVLLKRNPEINKEMEQQAIKLLAALFYSQQDVPTFGWQTRERWNGLIQWMEQYHLLEKGLMPEEVFTNEFIEKLSQASLR